MDINDVSLCEKLVMKVIWDAKENLPLRDIMSRVNQENNKSWKPQTVSTFLARLVKKGYITVYRKGRYSYYVPSISKDDFLRATIDENIEFFGKGDRIAFACNLCQEVLSQEEVQKLKEKLNDLY